MARNWIPWLHCHDQAQPDGFVVQYLWTRSWWTCLSTGIRPGDLQRSCPASAFLWLFNVRATHRGTLIIFTPRSSYTPLAGGQLLFRHIFSTYSQAHIKDPFGCSHTTKSACSSMHPGILVPQVQPVWAENPGHISSSSRSFKKMNPIGCIECGYWYNLLITHLAGLSTLNKQTVEDNFRNFNYIHCSLAKLCIKVTICVCPAQL